LYNPYKNIQVEGGKMGTFPRTIVGGVSLPRLIIGTNWFLGYSHTSLAKDQFIKSLMDPQRVEEILVIFLKAGVDAILGPPLLSNFKAAIVSAEQRTGRRLIRIITPNFNVKPGGPAEFDPEPVIENCKKEGATFCLPHQIVTDALIDRRDMVIRDLETYTHLIRQYEMIPGLSTHMPEAVTLADQQKADIETYLQIYNAAGFMMPVEADWEMRVIQESRKPVIVIKPLAAGRLLPPVGLSFVWSTIRQQDMVAVGTLTPDEAAEVIELSLSFINRKIPEIELQKTRSKSILDKPDL
jgi:hypothetical protein